MPRKNISLNWALWYNNSTAKTVLGRTNNMLTKITLDNFKSFKNKTTVDLAKTNYTILPQNVADNGILKGCIFVGANASGKSTIILGVKLLLDFLFSERNLNSGIFLCMFGNGPCYSLSYEFLVEKKKINYFLRLMWSKRSFLKSFGLMMRLCLKEWGFRQSRTLPNQLGWTMMKQMSARTHCFYGRCTLTQSLLPILRWVHGWTI